MKNIIKYIKYIILALIGILLLAYVFKAQSLNNIINLIVSSNLYLLILASIIFFVIHIFRAARWGTLITHLNIKASNYTLYNAIISSLLVNIFITRFGEIYRCVIVNKINKAPTSVLFGTVIAERIIDLLSLFVVSIVLFITNYKISLAYLKDYTIQKLISRNFLLIAVFCIVILLIFSIVFARILYRYEGKNILIIKIKNFIKGLYKGIISITQIKHKLLFFVYTIIIWICYLLFTYIITLAFPPTSNLSISVSLLILILSGFAMALPIQSGIGAFHILVSNAMILYGIPSEQALAYATLAHGLPLVTVIVLGSIAFLSIHFRLHKKKKYAKLRYSPK